MRTNKPAKWFRLYAEFATDPKVQMMSELDQRRFIMVLCLRCGNGDVTLHDAEIAFQLRITDQEWATTKASLMGKNLITEDGKPVAWDKRQFATDTSAERVAKHRAHKKEVGNKGVTLHVIKSNALETETETETEKTSDATHLPTPPEKTPGAVDPLACPVEQIIEAYHDAMPLNPRCKVLTPKRRVMIRQRWREAARMTNRPFGYATRSDGLRAWRQFFEVCAESDFLTGKVPGRDGAPPFVADVDFLFSPHGFAKVLENKYHREVA